MAADPTQVRVAASGSLMRAPTATANPANEAASWPAGWVDLGILDQGDPITLTAKLETTDIFGWGYADPLRNVNTSRKNELKVKIVQTTGTALKTAFGGGTIETLSAGHYQYHPPALSDVDEFKIGFNVIDGTTVGKWILNRAKVSDFGSITFKSDTAIAFELTITQLGVSSGDAWTFLTNDAAMAS